VTALVPPACATRFASEASVPDRRGWFKTLQDRLQSTVSRCAWPASYFDILFAANRLFKRLLVQPKPRLPTKRPFRERKITSGIGPR
jgi:hypothetical protein